MKKLIKGKNAKKLIAVLVVLLLALCIGIGYLVYEKIYRLPSLDEIIETNFAVTQLPASKQNVRMELDAEYNDYLFSENEDTEDNAEESDNDEKIVSSMEDNDGNVKNDGVTEKEDTVKLSYAVKKLIDMDVVNDKNTNHINATIASRANEKNLVQNYDIYIDKMDIKYGFYYNKSESDDNWLFKIFSAANSKDDVRTVYVESDNEKVLKEMTSQLFTDYNVELNEEKTQYIITCKTNYLVAETLLGNNRFIFKTDDAYNKEITDFLTECSEIMTVSVKMTADKKTKLVDNIVIENDDSINECMKNYSKKSKFIVKHLKFELKNLERNNIDLYVPVDITAKAEKVN